MDTVLAPPEKLTELAKPPREFGAAEEVEAYAEEALSQAKRDGLWLAVRARWIALFVIAFLLPVTNPNWDVLYYHALLIGFALIGWAQLRVGRLGRSRPELILIFCDLVLLTSVVVVPNPWSDGDWPTAIQYRFGGFIFFFVLLAGATLAYSWRTVVAFGVWTASLWTIGLVWANWKSNSRPEFTERIHEVFPNDPVLAAIMDPNSFNYAWRLQEVVAFLIVSAILALTVRRSGDLLKNHAASERERTNLSRYFSPNVVEELAHNDEPLKKVRMQNVAVLFIDIVGFTKYANGRQPDQVIATLRAFHGKMEEEVFRHGGTLDKYLGDGLMATFGTPSAGEHDASNALRCAQAMISALAELNIQRTTVGEPPIEAGVGVHYGPVVLGDIGANRLEFAVIGNTVNVASRLEGLSRAMNCGLVVSDDLVGRIEQEVEQTNALLQPLHKQPPQDIRGLEAPLAVWTQERA